MDNQQVTDVELGWFVGIFEGEGSIGLAKLRAVKQKSRGYCYSPRFSITNTDAGVIIKCIEFLRKLNIGFYIQEKKKASVHHMQLFTLRVDRFSYLAKLLPLLIPHLAGSRKVKTSLVLEFVQSRLGNGLNKAGKAHTHIPYSNRDCEIGELLNNWHPNDYTRSADDLRRYSLNSDRKAENVAEMTTSAP